MGDGADRARELDEAKELEIDSELIQLQAKIRVLSKMVNNAQKQHRNLTGKNYNF